jgi:oligoribonuclease
MKQRARGNLLWFDGETTGLKPLAGAVFLELSAIATTPLLEELGRFSMVVAQPGLDVSKVDKEVIDMHMKNGLWAEVAATPSTQDLAFVGAQLEAFARLHKTIECVDPVCGEPWKSPLCGATPSFDRTFLNVYLPFFERKLSHRHIDVSSLRELCNAAQLPFPDGDSPAHRGLPDTEFALNRCRYFHSMLYYGALTIANPNVMGVSI